MLPRRTLASNCAAGLACALAARLLPALAQVAPPLNKDAPLDKIPNGLAQQAFANHLISAMARSVPNRNITVSPMSAAAALAVIAQGSDDALAHSIRQTLRLPGEANDRSVLAQLLEALIPGTDPSPLVTASLLVLDPEIQPNPAPLAQLRKLQIEVRDDNLSDPASIENINAWVKGKTHGLIPAILDQAPGAGALMALNALYFNDKWQMPFDASRTAQRPFTGTDGLAGPVAMMMQEGRFRFRQEGRLIGVDLGFADPRFALVVVTTQDKPASAHVLARRVHGWLGGAEFTDAAGSLHLPRLLLEGSNDLIAPLRALGLRDGPTSLAGFGVKPPQIASIAQKAVLRLDEKGAEAAAATAVVATRSVSSTEVHMVVDKPFMFALRDKSTGFVVLAGYVARPEDGRM